MTNAEIDRLVATEVMELKAKWSCLEVADTNHPELCNFYANEILNYEECTWVDDLHNSPMACESGQWWWWKDGKPFMRCVDLSPTTDPAHCRMVEDKMWADNYNELTDSQTGKHEIIFVSPDASDCYTVVKSDYNLAVCLAALRVLGVEVE